MLTLVLAWLAAAAAPVASGGAAVDHDFHLSRLTVNANPETHSVELTLYTFIDDVHLAIADDPRVTPDGSVHPDSIRLTTPRELPAADSLVARLLRKNFTLASGGKTLPLTYLGKEAADDPYGIYLYLRAPLPDTAGRDVTDRALELHADFLCALYGDQQNVVVWQRDGVQSGYSLLTPATREATSR